MSRSPSITVAGAGVLGLTTALALADAGAEVALFDPAPAGPNASSVAAGMLAPAFEAVLDPLVAPHFDLMLAARDQWAGLEARLGVAIDRAGAAAVGDDAFLAQAERGLRGLGLHPTVLPRRALDALATGLGPAIGQGLLTREDWRIEPQPAMAALRAAAKTAGVVFHDRAATGFEGAERLVIATGADPSLGVLAPHLSRISPVKGQLLRYRSSAATSLVLRAAGAYAISSDDGLVVGATMEPGRSDREHDPVALAPVAQAALGLFPDLAEAEVAAQAGVRAATPDGLPLVGRGRHPGVLLAVGARRNGWLLAPLVAKIIAACVTEGEAGPYAGRLDPARFEAAGGGGAK